LRVEARDHGVRVSVLCPGVIRTPILTGGRFGRVGFAGVSEAEMRAMWERLWPMDPDVFAERVLRAVAADQAIIVVPRWWKLMWYVERLSPWLSLKVAEMGIRKLRRELAALREKKHGGAI
jgi:short-subunit dehydrogenase